MATIKKTGITFNELPGTWKVVDTFQWRDDEELWLVERESYDGFEEYTPPMIVSYGAEKLVMLNVRGFEDLPNPFEVELRLQGYLNRATYGGGPLIYLMGDNEEIACSDCAAYNTDAIITREIYYEGPTRYCESCNAEIVSAYGDPDAEEGEDE